MHSTSPAPALIVLHRKPGWVSPNNFGYGWTLHCYVLSSLPPGRLSPFICLGLHDLGGCCVLFALLPVFLSIPAGSFFITPVFLDRSFPMCRAQQAFVMCRCSFSSKSTSTSKQLLVYLPYLSSSSRMFFPMALPPFRTGPGHQQLEGVQ